MRSLRLIGEGTSCYHVMSRVVEKRFYLKDLEKNVFCDMLRRVAAFSGVNVLTFCVMDNHFHLLIEVPERTEINDDVLMTRLKQIYRGRDWGKVQSEFERCEGNHMWEKAVREKYTRRMYDLSEFMKTLKLRFSIWYNATNGRFGSLWSERFKSVLVEGRDSVLLTVATYIDLNAVRAGIVDDPADYRWCGYGAICLGNVQAMSGLRKLVYLGSQNKRKWDDAAGWYREYFETALSKQVTRENPEEMSCNFSKKSFLCCRVRYFSDGYVLGGRDFVDGVFARRRELFSARRRSGARKMRGGEWGDLYVMRDLQVDVIG